MHKLKTLTAFTWSALAVCAFLLAGCSGAGEEADAGGGTDAEVDQEAVKADFEQTMEAYNAAETAQEKADIWFAFLERNPDTNYTYGTINYLVQQHYIRELEDPEAAIVFIEESMANIADADRKSQVKGLLINLYGETGDIPAIEAIVVEMEAAGEISASDHLAIANAAKEAGAADLSLSHAEMAAEKATVENLRAQNPDSNASDARLLRRANRLKANAYETMAMVKMDAGSLDESLDLFAQAGNHTMFNFVNVAMTDINLNWAKALMEKGQYQDAMARVAPDAIMQGADSAMELFKEAYIKSGGSEENMDQVKADWREKLARQVPDFTAYSYDEEANPVSYDSLKGEVTLLSFFFPT